MLKHITPLLIFLLISNTIYAENKFSSVVGFTENSGELHQEFYQGSPLIRYIYDDSQFRILFRNDGWDYEWIRGNDFNENSTPQLKSEVIRLRFLNAGNVAIIEPIEKSPVSKRNVALEKGYAVYKEDLNFKKLIYHSIYPNIDLEFAFSSENGTPKVKYSFIVHPGGNSEDIQLVIDGANVPSIIDEELNLSSSYGSLRESQPVYLINDGQQQVVGKFKHTGNVVSFADVPSSDKDIIIDPEIIYGSYYGGNGKDKVESIKVDSEGNLIVAGITASTNFPVTTGAYQQTYGGGQFDAFLFKFSPDFDLLWSTYFGGTQADYGWSVVADSNDNIYLCGLTLSSGMATAGADQVLYDGIEGDGFVARFDPAGTLQWSRYYGGGKKDEILGAYITLNQELLINGTTKSSDSISTPDVYQEIYAEGEGDGFLARLDLDGHTLWSTYFGDIGNDRFHSVAEDSKGNIICVGTTPSPWNLATTGAHQTDHGGLIDALLVKFTSEGHRIWATYLGGSGNERGRECKIDGDDNIYMNGWTESATNIASPNGWDTSYNFNGNGSIDAFLSKFDSNGVMKWATYFGGNEDDFDRGLAYDPNGFLYMAGSTYSDSGIVYGNAYQYVMDGVSDMFFCKFTIEGSLVWSSYFGGSGDENMNNYCNVVEVDKDHNIYLSGGTTSSDSIATNDAYQGTYSGGNFDVTVVKMSDPCLDSLKLYLDADKDGYGSLSDSIVTCIVPEGYVSNHSDCNDSVASVNPAALETCNNIDDNCNNQIDEGVIVTFYFDADGDNYGNINLTVEGCSAPSGYVNSGTDCNDSIPEINPGMAEICNGIDDNCDEQSDEGLLLILYEDLDNDTYGNPAAFVQSCSPISGYVMDNTDCNDSNSEIHPSASELCNTIDDDCNNQVDDNIVSASINPTGNVTTCKGTPILLQANTGDGYSYVWTKNGTPIEGVTNSSYSTSTAGTYSVIVTHNGCTATSSATTLSVNSLPSATITPSGTTTVCKDEVVNFLANTGTGLSYQWQNISGNISGATDPGYTTSVASTYKVVVTNSSTGCSKTSSGSKLKNFAAVQVKITHTGTLNICTTDSVVLSAKVVAGYSYQWYKDNGPILNATSSTFVASQGGTYKYLATSPDGCTKYSNTKNVTDCKVTSESQTGHAQVGVYPNPSDGSFVIELSMTTLADETAEIEILNTVGQCVFRDFIRVKEGVERQSIQLSEDCAAGMYIVKVITNDRVFTTPLVLKR